MKTETLDVILNYLGQSWRVVDQAIEPVSLSGLLADGWRPVRETPFAARTVVDSTPSVLILLERESDEKFGFGFNPA